MACFYSPPAALMRGPRFCRKEGKGLEEKEKRVKAFWSDLLYEIGLSF
jgi:hypothetical protein